MVVARAADDAVGVPCRFRRAAAPAAPTESADSVLVRLAERVPFSRLPVLLCLPAAAVAPYAAIRGADLSEALARDLFLYAVVAVQWLTGWAVLVAALLTTRRRSPRDHELRASRLDVTTQCVE